VASAAIEGRIFEGGVASGDLAALCRERQVIQAVLVEDENPVRVHVLWCLSGQASCRRQAGSVAAVLEDRKTWNTARRGLVQIFRDRRVALCRFERIDYMAVVAFRELPL
jgi:hypothetical protein